MIKIVTDAASNVPKPFVDQYGITVLSSSIVFPDREFRELDVKYEDFCKMLKTYKEPPRTGSPTSAEFVKVYVDLGKEAGTIFSIHISSKLANIYRNASIAQDIFNKKKKGKPPEVMAIDTRMLDMGSGLIALEAAMAAREGKDKDYVKRLIDTLIKEVKAYFYVDTLEYMVKGGRVKRITGITAGLLGMKPILTMEDGEIITKDKAIGRDKAIERMLTLMEKDIVQGVPIKVVVVDAMAILEGDNLLKTIKGRFNCAETIRTTISASITTHAGPGSLGAIFYPL